MSNTASRSFASLASRLVSRCVSGFAQRVMCAVAGVLTLLAAQGCTGGIVYDEFAEIGEHTWHQDSLAVFRTEIADSTAAYDIWLQVRNDNDYSFANLWLFVDVVAPDGTMRRDTMECLLANPDGSWRGGGWGSLYTVRCPYMSAVRFTKAGPYTFRLTQGMRDNRLVGIHNIGLLIERHENSSE